MRTITILLALVVVLGFVSEAGAYGPSIYCDRSVEVGPYRFGFADWAPGGNVVGISMQPWTAMYLGPLGYQEVPFTATQGLVGFCVFVVGMIALVTVGTIRWKRKWAG
jgi:hypothetical protein